MKKTLLALMALVVLAGCESPTAPVPIPNITNINTNTNNIGGGLTDPNAVSSQCLPSEETPIRVDLTIPTSAQVGVNAPIDATPKSAAGKRSDGCNILQGIFWSTAQPATCYVPTPSEFNTNMRCLQSGTCSISATVPGRGASGAGTVVCQ